MSDIITVIFLIVAISFVATVEIMISKDKLKRVSTYSYKAVVRRTLFLFCIAVLISLIVYVLSGSIEVTITLGVLLFFGVIGGCIYGFLWEYQTKRRGGRKED